jgi:hypothetical protein
MLHGLMKIWFNFDGWKIPCQNLILILNGRIQIKFCYFKLCYMLNYRYFGMKFNVNLLNFLPFKLVIYSIFFNFKSSISKVGVFLLKLNM